MAAIEAAARAHHVETTEPLRDRYRLEADLARCLDGTGGDNALRMSLSSYVLAARLEQVAAAATERLLAMSGGRYSLVHCDDAERGRGRSGLALRVVDGWTGRRRDTASLSGGESFYTSLALALGLADVVTAEAGGADRRDPLRRRGLRLARRRHARRRSWTCSTGCAAAAGWSGSSATSPTCATGSRRGSRS